MLKVIIDSNATPVLQLQARRMEFYGEITHFGLVFEGNIPAIQDFIKVLMYEQVKSTFDINIQVDDYVFVDCNLLAAEWADLSCFTDESEITLTFSADKKL